MIGSRKDLHQRVNLFYRLLPPAQSEKQLDCLIIEPSAHHPCRIACCNAIGWNVSGNGGVRPDYGAIANMHSRHYGHVLAYPHVVSDNGVAFKRQFILHWRNHPSPGAAHDIKRIGCGAIHPVVRAVHYEIHTSGNSAEIAYDEPIANEIIEMSYMLLKPVGSIDIIVISLVTDDDSRILYHILYVAHARNSGIREHRIFIGKLIHDFFMTIHFTDVMSGSCLVAALYLVNGLAAYAEILIRHFFDCDREELLRDIGYLRGCGCKPFYKQPFLFSGQPAALHRYIWHDNVLLSCCRHALFVCLRAET